MRIGLFGGSFNPIQSSHVQLVNSVLEKRLVDDIWIIPCGNHAFGKDLASSEDRVKMIELAFPNNPKVKIKHTEIDSKEQSKTYQTVARLKQGSPHDFYWICGSDIYPEFNRWHNYEQLAKEVEFIVHYRGPTKPSEGSPMRIAHFLTDYIGGASSTLVREKIKAEESISGLVPESVERYINQKELYT